MKEFILNLKSGYQRALGFTLTLGFIALLILAWGSYCPKLHYLNAYLPKGDAVIQFTPSETKTLNQLIAKGVVISASDLYNDTISFYSTLITWLIGILAVSGLVGFVYIRGKSREETEEEARKAVDVYFALAATHEMLREKAEAEVDAQVDPIRSGLETLEVFSREKEELKKSIKRLEEKVELLLAGVPKTIPAASVNAPPSSPAPAAPAPATASLPGASGSPAPQSAPAEPNPVPPKSSEEKA